jgi:hypothetical protein
MDAAHGRGGRRADASANDNSWPNLTIDSKLSVAGSVRRGRKHNDYRQLLAVFCPPRMAQIGQKRPLITYEFRAHSVAAALKTVLVVKNPAGGSSG